MVLTSTQRKQIAAARDAQRRKKLDAHSSGYRSLDRVLRDLDRAVEFRLK